VTSVDLDKWGSIWSMARWRRLSSTAWSEERSSSPLDSLFTTRRFQMIAYM